MSDIIDRIDELVYEQLAGGEPLGGYDFDDPQYPRCPHCDRHWHGLPVTQRIASMYAFGTFDPEYSYAQDDSPILCEGSDFIGPRRPPAVSQFQWGSLGRARDVTVTVSPPTIGPQNVFGQITSWLDQMIQTIFLGFELISGSFTSGSFTITTGPPIMQFRSSPPPVCTPVPDVAVEFGPQNWHHELMRSHHQPPRQWDTPITRRVRAHWPDFTRHDCPILERPGYDFSDYARETPPAWAATATTGRIQPIRRERTMARRTRRRARR